MANVFIVRPFGSDRPVVKKNKDGNPEIVSFNFDKVENELIKPAMKEFDLSGGNTGEVFAAGEIREDMFSELLLSDIVIVDITIYNANVFYELGVRHSLRDKGTILIKCAGFDDTPFDIFGLRYVTYDKDNPADALPDLKRTIKETMGGDRKDSPVFNMLPGLKEQDTEKFLAVPEEFGEEVTIATKAEMIGKLKLLSNEAMGFPWEIQANRYLGESFFALEGLPDARMLWEKVKAKDKNDFQANDRLSTIYQRLADIKMTSNPVEGEAMLTQSDLANEIILKNYAGLDIGKRAEVYALKGSNAKARWLNEWKNLSDSNKEMAALNSFNLETAYENYENGYYENLNHFYSGINALGLLTIIITLAKRYPDQWALVHDETEEKWKIDKLENKRANLVVSLQFSLEAEKRRLTASGKNDNGFNITDADFFCLTSANPARVAIMYQKALKGADNFLLLESTKKQLKLYASLNVLADNTKAALDIINAIEIKPNWDNIHYLLFTGHMIDKPGRSEPRFPPSRETEIRQKILEKVREIQSGFKEKISILGIAGGACGGDILFHEVCQELKIKTQLFLAMPPEDFIVESVGFAGPGWISRFHELHGNEEISNFELAGKKELPKWLQKKIGYNIWMRNNLWQLNSSLIKGGDNMTLLAFWDGESEEGPGGTGHMVQVANEKGAKVIIIE